LFSGENEPPLYCEKCGKAFPWTTNKIHDYVQGTDTPIKYTDTPIKWLEGFFRKFDKIVNRLQERHEDRPTITVADEYDIRDIIHPFLLVRFEDTCTEEWTPSYVGKSSRMDFLLKNERIVIESKITRERHGQKEIGDELIVDKERYRSHPDCKTLICFIYDKNSFIENPQGFVKDIKIAG
jgi:hypothetical protein